MKNSLRVFVLLTLSCAVLTVFASADMGPKPQLTVRVEHAPEELYYLDLLAEGEYEDYTYGDGNSPYSGLDWSYSDEEAAALNEDLLDALRAVGAKKITMCTPYPEEVNLHEKVYFEEEGFEILSLAGLGKEDPRSIPKTGLDEIYGLVMKSWDPASDTLFISCTGLPSLPLVPRLEKELGVPVITSNLAGVWNISRFFNAYSDKAKQLGSLFSL